MVNMSPNSYPLVYIITRNHNGFELTSECIESLLKMKYPNFKILVVDDGSSDDSCYRLSSKYPMVEFMKLDRYYEYCKALNYGMISAIDNKADYVFLVNNDTKDFSDNYLDEMIKCFTEDEKIGIAGSKVFDYTGRCIHDCKSKYPLRIVMMNIPTEGYVIKVDVILKIGKLDERLVRYFEDVDFLARLNKAGFISRCVSSVSFKHLCGGTSKKQPFIQNYYRVRNIIWMIREYHKDKSFLQRFKLFSYPMKVHIVRIYMLFMKLQFEKGFKVTYAVTLGLLHGWLKRWKK